MYIVTLWTQKSWWNDMKILFNFLTRILAGPLLDAYKARLEAQSDQDKLAADLAVKNIEAELEVRRNAKEIRLATAGFWEQRVLSVLIAAPFIFHLWSVWIDTQFKLGLQIDKFPAPFDEWGGAILLSFFGVQVLSNGFQAIAGSLASRLKK